MTTQISIIGLGYVGLPLAIELSKTFKVVGLDINTRRIQQLKEGVDQTREVESYQLKKSTLAYTSDYNAIAECNFHIITVPTPVNKSKQPDLQPLISASQTVGKILKKGDIVVYESTVFPGCTEEVCVPILEATSGLKFNVDFYCGYSPERVNPGDKERTVAKIMKVISGSTPQALEKIAQVYSTAITAGVYKASSIKVAEAAKVIENSQRDINIAFINELSIIFNRLDLDTREVLAAASTKWNFLQFYPGLVGGHCIGVDPYYLTHKAESVGYHPEVILAGRRINDSMGAYVASQTIKKMIHRGINVNSSKILILGLTFKENCPDIRNSKVIDIIHELKEFGCTVDAYDPHALPEDVEHEFNMPSQSKDCLNHLVDYQAVIIAVAHKEFLDIDWSKRHSEQQIIFDVKGLLPRKYIDGRL